MSKYLPKSTKKLFIQINFPSMPQMLLFLNNFKKEGYSQFEWIFIQCIVWLGVIMFMISLCYLNLSEIGLKVFELSLILCICMNVGRLKTFIRKYILNFSFNILKLWLNVQTVYLASFTEKLSVSFKWWVLQLNF